MMKMTISGKRLLSMALALVMVFGLAPQARADDTFLTEMRVEITPPAAGQSPDFTVRVPADANYMVVEGGYWKDLDAGYLMRPEDKFQPGSRYLMMAQLYPKQGYQMEQGFGYKTKLIVNGEPVNLEDGWSGLAGGHMQAYFTTPGTATAKNKVTVTFKIQGGTWDGTDGKDKTVSILLIDKKGTLGAGQIPTGMKPLEGYAAEGSWDIAPSTAADGITGDVTYTYTFPQASSAPVMADYTVNHLQEGLDGTYASIEIQTLSGVVGADTAAEAKPYEGFTARDVPTKTIAADGTTVVEIWYARNIHELKWDFQDGGCMTQYTQGQVPFGTPITVPKPSKIGYTFGGWTPDVPADMPDKDLAFTAQWVEQMPDPTRAMYTVKHMQEKLWEAGSFEQVGFDESFGTIGENTAAKARDYSGFTAQPVTQKKIAADGTTVVEVKYTRNIHKLTFDPNGGQFEGSESVDLPFGTPITAPKTVRKGFTFAGWEPAAPDAMPDKDVTCVAQWTPDAHTHELTRVEGCEPTPGSDGWKSYYECSCGKFFEDEDGTREIGNLREWKQGAGKIPALGYKFLEGMNATWKKDSKKDLTFRANGDLDCFESLEVDGRIVDRKHYTVTSGSTVVKLKDEYLQGLKVGTHKLKANFIDGQCETQFKVAEAPKAVNPKTGDESRLLLWSLISMMSLAAMVSLSRKKREQG